eukprot:CAMPEP_0176460550 /NCGR_PEP_ID=MMETSP0127-20121128/34049_1 /TAXON_ID=938130 /ORGANISM="Platyophrya macrostoma, Strain WH" /LENGTH=107 /DNA_ID=CAMNT_0017851919 /DNA_START=135 /DNA_END=455 /DNA_ORIENTATION=+
MSLGHSPLAFYTACLASYLMSFPSSQSWPLASWALVSCGSGGFLALLTGEWSIGAAVAGQLLTCGVVIKACVRGTTSTTHHHASGERESPKTAVVAVPRRSSSSTCV